MAIAQTTALPVMIISSCQPIDLFAIEMAIAHLTLDTRR